MSSYEKPQQSADFNDDEIIERIAGLVVSQVSQEEIAKIFGVSQERISQLLQMPTFIKIIEAKKKELGLQYEETNNLIDGVEKLAWEKVHKHLNFGADADYALRAAMVANKANRKGGMLGNAALSADQGGRAIITLNQTFITKLTQIGKEAATEIQAATSKSVKLLPTQDNRKTIDIANPAEIEKLLDPQKPKIDNAFGLGDIKELDGSTD